MRGGTGKWVKLTQLDPDEGVRERVEGIREEADEG